MPLALYRDEEVFPERSTEAGRMYIEAKDKQTLVSAGEIRFVKASNVDLIIYNSKSGRTRLKWTRTEGENGRLSGEASLNTLVNLAAAKIISLQDGEQASRSSRKGCLFNEV
jgi:hypothetical protein